MAQPTSGRETSRRKNVKKKEMRRGINGGKTREEEKMKREKKLERKQQEIKTSRALRR
jgi:hypothetical protein